MEKVADQFSLQSEIVQLRAILRGLASEDEVERQAAAAQATDVARVAAVLIRAVETQQSLDCGGDGQAESVLAAALRRSLDAMAREEAAARATPERQE